MASCYGCAPKTTASNYEFRDCSSLRLSSAAGKQTRRELLSVDSTRRTRSKCKTAPHHPRCPLRASYAIKHFWSVLQRGSHIIPLVMTPRIYVLLTIYTVLYALAVLGLCWYGNGRRLRLSSSVRLGHIVLKKPPNEEQRMSPLHCVDIMLTRYQMLSWSLWSHLVWSLGGGGPISHRARSATSSGIKSH